MILLSVLSITLLIGISSFKIPLRIVNSLIPDRTSFLTAAGPQIHCRVLSNMHARKYWTGAGLPYFTYIYSP